MVLKLPDLPPTGSRQGTVAFQLLQLLHFTLDDPPADPNGNHEGHLED